MPASAANTFTTPLQPMYEPEEAYQIHVKLPNSGTVAKGTILGEITASPGNFKAYASGSSDGSQNPRAILAYDVTVDGSGNHSYAGADQGVTYPSAPAFISGYFSCADLTGLDATALTNRTAWALINGTTSAGCLRIG